MTTRRNALWLIAGDNAIRRAMTWAVIFAASWALLEISLGAELRSPFNLLQIVWCRYATHLGICLLLWGWRRPTALWKTSRPILHVSRSLMMVIMPAAFMLAIHLGIAAEFVWSVFWIAPALIIALARLFLEEKSATRRRRCERRGIPRSGSDHRASLAAVVDGLGPCFDRCRIVQYLRGDDTITA